MSELLKLNLAAGTSILPGWVNTDIQPQSNDVILMDLRQRFPWADGSASRIIISHALEHFDCNVAYGILSECFRVLGPQGVLRVCVPDITRVAMFKERHNGLPEYEAFYVQRFGMKPIPSLCRQHGHQSLWTPELLTVVLCEIGFCHVEFLPQNVSMISDMQGIDGHDHVIGYDNNAIETCNCEAYK